MTDAITKASIALPAGNGAQTIFFVPVKLGNSNVNQIMLVFPPGCSGLVGIRLEYAIHPVYPIDGTGWFILDDFVLIIPVTGQGNSGDWRLVGYNTDFNPHTVDAYFSYDWVKTGSQAPTSTLVSL